MEKKQIKIGDVKIGAGAPVSVQSMTNTKTDDVAGTLAQINELANAGWEVTGSIPVLSTTKRLTETPGTRN